jgi:hypothetical protein
VDGDPSKLPIGKKLRARILWDIPGTEPYQFALSSLDHIVKLKSRTLAQGDEDSLTSLVEEIYLVGTILEDVRVCRVDADRGLFLDVQKDLEAVVHVSKFLISVASHSYLILLDFRRVGRACPNSFWDVWAIQNRFKAPSTCNWVLSVGWCSAVFDEGERIGTEMASS